MSPVGQFTPRLENDLSVSEMHLVIPFQRLRDAPGVSGLTLYPHPPRKTFKRLRDGLCGCLCVEGNLITLGGLQV